MEDLLGSCERDDSAAGDELIDELLKKGKGDLVSFMTYPGEFHYFTRAHVLRDAWHRVDDFFSANLKHSDVGDGLEAVPR